MLSRTAPGAGSPGTQGRSLDPPARTAPAADRGISRRLWIVLCLLFLTSSVISVTAVIVLVGWITAL
jgi:hypothetical protein